MLRGEIKVEKINDLGGKIRGRIEKRIQTWIRLLRFVAPPSSAFSYSTKHIQF
jgi:hypothetical protein